MSQQQFIAFMSQEFLGQALKLDWVFTHVSQREYANFTDCRLVKSTSSFPTIFLAPKHIGKAHSKSFTKLPKSGRQSP